MKLKEAEENWGFYFTYSFVIEQAALHIQQTFEFLCSFWACVIYFVFRDYPLMIFHYALISGPYSLGGTCKHVQDRKPNKKSLDKS